MIRLKSIFLSVPWLLYFSSFSASFGGSYLNAAYGIIVVLISISSIWVSKKPIHNLLNTWLFTDTDMNIWYYCKAC